MKQSSNFVSNWTEPNHYWHDESKQRNVKKKNIESNRIEIKKKLHIYVVWSKKSCTLLTEFVSTNFSDRIETYFRFLYVFWNLSLYIIQLYVLDNVDGQASFDARSKKFPTPFSAPSGDYFGPSDKWKHDGGEFVMIVILWHHVCVVFAEVWWMSTNGSLLEGCVWYSGCLAWKDDA